MTSDVKANNRVTNFDAANMPDEPRTYPGRRKKAEWDVIAQASFDRAAHLPED